MEDELSTVEEKGKEVTKEQKQHLYNRVEKLKRVNAALLAENDMFERFISRLDPQDLLSQPGEDSLEAAEASQLEGGGRGRRQRSRSSIADRLHLLTLEQKLYVAQQEVQETLQDKEKLKQRYEKIQDNNEASLQEAELRLADIQKAKKEFERKLLKPMKDNRLEMKEPKRVLQYIRDTSVVSQMEKLNLKNQALKVHEKKLQQQLRQTSTQKDIGAAEFKDVVFHDFSGQRIHQNLDELQVNNLKVQLNLSSHKEKLQNVTRESAELSSEISNRKQTLVKIEEEMRRAEEERSKAEAVNRHLRRQMTDYQAPDIAEYMRVKERHKKLKQSIHNWERKVGIAQMALRSHAKARSTQRATLAPANSAEAGARSKDRQLSVKLPYIAEHRA